MENQERGDKSPNPATPPRPRVSGSTMWLMLLLMLLAVIFYFNSRSTSRSEISYSFFLEQVRAGNVESVDFQSSSLLFGKFKPGREPFEPLRDAITPPATSPTTESTTADAATADASTAEGTNDAATAEPNNSDAAKSTDSKANATKASAPQRLNNDFRVTLPPVGGEDLARLLDQQQVVVHAEPPVDNAGTILFIYLFISILLFAGVWIMFRRAREQFMGGGILSGFSKSPAKRYETGKKPITFADVAGLEGVKTDLQEIVDFLKSPEKFQRLGGRVPKGVLLMGPPGTGKTLLARAVAGEAGVPFFSINGSEFIQMFVGVGASRVRDMFKTAKEASPSILFVDEIDAVGRHRGAGLGGGHDEREQTLNQILSEMDGFTPTESVIVVAATNRPDVLDPALLRPGRFDRHVTVDRPNLKGRLAIFKVHTREVPLADDVDLERLAHGTVGLTGADIRNLVNEAALWATRNDKDRVSMDDFEYARDRVLMGAKREELLTGKEKRMTAYHEAGHALLAWVLPGVKRLHKVTIIPRGRALGVTQLIPEEDRLNVGESDLFADLVCVLGGRAAEKMIYNEYSAGAESDINHVSRIARRMVTHWGMSDRLGPISYRTGEEHPFLGRDISEAREFSEHTAQIIDEEVSRIVHQAADKATELLEQHRDKLEALTDALEEREVLDEYEVEALIGPSANPRPKPIGQENSASSSTSGSQPDASDS